MHQASDRIVGHHKAIEFLSDQVWSPTAQQGLASSQVGLQFVESGFNLPALVIQGGQIFRLRLLWIKDGRDQAVELVLIRWLARGGSTAIQFVFHHPDLQHDAR